MKTLSAAFCVLVLSGAAASAQPIQSPQDAACRGEAERRVFGTPNLEGEDLVARGTRFWKECMARSQKAAAPAGTPKGKGKAKRTRKQRA